MTAVDRLVVILASLVLFVEAIGFISAMISYDFLGLTLMAIEQAVRQVRPGAVFLAIVLLVLAVMLFELGIRSRYRHKAIVRGTSLGEVRISLVAIENLVRRVARQVRGVREVDTRVNTSQDGIEASLSVMVAPDISIPEVCDDLQARIEQYIRDTVGVNTMKIRVNVRNVSGSEQRTSRVE